MQYVTYKDLVVRYGRRSALDVLHLLETLTQIRNEVISIDVDSRFDKALKALADIDYAANSN